MFVMDDVNDNNVAILKSKIGENPAMRETDK